MKITFKFVRIVLGALVGALLWAGCASATSTASHPQRPMLETTLDLQDVGPDNHPAWYTGNFDQIHNLQPWDEESIQ